MLTINYYYLTIFAFFFFFFQINFLVRYDYVKIPMGTIFGLALNPSGVFCATLLRVSHRKNLPHFLLYKRETEGVVYHQLFFIYGYLTFGSTSGLTHLWEAFWFLYPTLKESSLTFCLISGEAKE